MLGTPADQAVPVRLKPRLTVAAADRRGPTPAPPAAHRATPGAGAAGRARTRLPAVPGPRRGRCSLAVIVVPLGDERLHQLHPVDRASARDLDRPRQLPAAVARLGVLGLVPAQRRADRRDGGRPDACSAWCWPPCCSTTSASSSARGPPACCARASTCRRCCRSRSPASSGAGSCTRSTARSTRRCATSGSAPSRTTGSATRTPRCYASWRVMVWIQLGYPLVIFMAGAAAHRPGAVRGRRDGRGVLVAAASGTSPSRRSGRSSTSCC